MPLADYLASKYLSADKKTSKKRKRKDPNTAGLTIADDDVNGWTSRAGQDDDDEDSPMIMGSGGSVGGLHQPTKKKVTWIRVGAEAPTDLEQAAADAILASAQAETARRIEEDDEAPAVVGGVDMALDGPTMSSGAMAGLQTAEQVTAALKRKEKAERKAMKDAGLGQDGKAQETIYRDASGRIINVAMKRAELRQKAEEEERKKKEEIEARQGDVQRREKELRRQELENAKIMPVARHADDEQLNDDMRARERWNDPMAQLLASKSESTGEKGTKKKSSSRKYNGAFEPNRYGIQPGWRWDGVDRGNGFERKWFAARNKAKDRAELEYAWQMDE